MTTGVGAPPGPAATLVEEEEESPFGAGAIVVTSIAAFVMISVLVCLVRSKQMTSNNGQHDISKYLTLYGSVIPRSIPYAVFGAMEGVLLKWATRVDPDFTVFKYWQVGGAWYHPYAFHVFGMMLGFALVMRIQIAYQRYWEGSTQCHQASSKWADAVMQVMAFDEASKDAFSDAALEFRMLILHYTSLMNACALIDIRRDDDLDCPLTLNREDPYLFRPNANQAILAAQQQGGGGGGGGGGDDTGRGSPSAQEPAARPSTKLKVSHRASTAPLQNLLSVRRTVAAKLNTDVNSFEAFEAEGGRDKQSVPASYGATAADMRCRARTRSTEGGLFSHQAAQACTGTGVDSDTSRAKLRRGSLSASSFAASAILLKGDKQTMRRLARANCFDVVGGVTQSEIDLLEPAAPGDRAFLVQTWIVRLMTNRLAAGGLAIPPPLLSRTYQVLSDGTAAAMQARKVSYVAFPFPLRQLLLVLLLVFNLIAPMCIAAFMNNEVLIGILAFFVNLGYQSLNEAAAELEHPFGLGANHLQLTAYQRQFNSKLAHLFDQTIPQLGYVTKRPPSPPRQRTDDGASRSPRRTTPMRAASSLSSQVAPAPAAHDAEVTTTPAAPSAQGASPRMKAYAPTSSPPA